MKRKFHHISFKYALEGVKYAFSTQPNFKVHTFIFFLVCFLSYYLQISKVEFLIILLTSALVFSLEMINTALESLGDEVSGGEWKELIKITKDLASGAVLVASLFAIAIALVIFIPHAF